MSNSYSTTVTELTCVHSSCNLAQRTELALRHHDHVPPIRGDNRSDLNG